MKKLFTAGLLLAGFAANAQINEEWWYQDLSSVSAVNIEGEGPKYYGIDTLSQKVKIFNLNHSLWKEIPIVVPTGYKLFTTQWLSKLLFNSDQKLEIGMSYSQYSPSTYITKYRYDIVDEDGTVTQTIPDVYSLYVMNINGKAKAFSTGRTYDFFGNGRPVAKVYSLPGTYSGQLKVPNQPDGDTYSELSPNPVERTAIIRYQLPAGATTGTVVVSDAVGRQIRTLAVQGNAGAVTLDCNGMAPGIYSYSVNGGTAEQFIIK